MKGMSTNKELLDYTLGATLKYIAMGLEIREPIIAPLLVVFFQNSPKIKTAHIPGLTTPVYS